MQKHIEGDRVAGVSYALQSSAQPAASVFIRCCCAHCVARRTLAWRPALGASVSGASCRIWLVASLFTKIIMLDVAVCIE